MTRLQNTFFLYIIIAIEGYVILASELLAMRQTTTFVGTGTDTVSIIIAAVLMPLAFGYQAGGRFLKKGKSGAFRTIRNKLLNNILISSAFLFVGLTYFVFQFFFVGLHQLGLHNILVQTTLYCVFFIVTPMFLLGQTVPLVSNYFSKERLSRITGKMLFISTMGSFAGSLVTTLILMDTIGVHHTVSLIFVLLFSLVILLGSKRSRNKTMAMLVILGFSFILNSDQAMGIMNIVHNNKYSTLIVMEDEEGTPHLYINGNDSSKYSATGEKHYYIELAEEVTIEAFPEDSLPRDILIIGAGGFTYGHDDDKHHYIFVDIDKNLKPVSEKFLLKGKLKDNKIFYPLPARAYLAQTDKKFDVIFLDAYLGGLSIPEHLVTQEFFQEVKKHLKNNGMVITNFILPYDFSGMFSKNMEKTMRSVFPYMSRLNADENFDAWVEGDTISNNIMYIYKHRTGTNHE